MHDAIIQYSNNISDLASRGQDLSRTLENMVYEVKDKEKRLKTITFFVDVISRMDESGGRNIEVYQALHDTIEELFVDCDYSWKSATWDDNI